MAAYIYANAAKARGYSVSRTCLQCCRDRDAKRKRERIATDPAYHANVVAWGRKSARKWMSDPDNKAKHNHRVSQRSWVYNNYHRLPRPLPDRCILYVAPRHYRMGPHRRDDRPWTYKMLVYRSERPGMMPPVGGIPVARITRTICDWQDDPIVIITPHTSCPDDWRWVVNYIERWSGRA